MFIKIELKGEEDKKYYTSIIEKYLILIIDIWTIVNWPISFFSVIFHELGHFIIGRLLKLKIDNIFIHIVFKNMWKINIIGGNIIPSQLMKISSLYLMILADPIITLSLAIIGLVLIGIDYKFLGISIFITNLLILINMYFYRKNKDTDLFRLLNFKHYIDQISIFAQNQIENDISNSAEPFPLGINEFHKTSKQSF